MAVSTTTGAAFALAPMQRLFLWLTAGLCAVPPLFLVLAATVDRVFALPAILVGLICAGVWLWFRPTRFVISPSTLQIVWPLRRRTIDRAAIATTRILSFEELRPDLGFALRIGAGGLWGGFGCLWTSRRGLVDLYISRLDRIVLIEQHDGRPLLISPERPQEFLRALER